jgi:hypothetical protein
LGASMLGLVPVWALAGKHGITTFPVLPAISCLTICADNDEDGGGQLAANECFARWKGAGCEARIVISDTPGTDIADVAASKAARHG